MRSWRRNAVQFRNTGRFLDADVLCSSDELTGCWLAVAYLSV